MATRILSESHPGTRRAGEICLPACPACGGLECLCRPRFFAGQLLTDQDLNRLDRYIRQKNRLHNRHLHGWGVVCGLEVTCDECDEGVRVGAGYGLSPCGDDVVVCDDVAVDVCSLIRRCTDHERRRRECDAPAPRDPNCEEGDETWILAVCYDEKPSRGVTALRDSGCACARCSGAIQDCGCGCGGAGKRAGGGGGGCSCGGNGNGNGHAQAHGHGGVQAAGRRPAAQCEPTLVCEGYRFEVYRAPLADPNARDQGALGRRAQQCLRPYLDFAQQVGAGSSPGAGANREQQQRLCCAMKDRLREILLTRPRHNCELLGRLNQVVCPRPDAQDFDQALARALQQIVLVWFEGMMACVCSVLLPPCPDPADDNCIPLAAVTVRRRDCRVRRVCNWTVHRKLATTLPALQYWLSILPFGRLLRRLIENACCHLMDRFRQSERETIQPGAQPATGATTGPAGAAPFASGTADTSRSAADETAQPFFRAADTMPFATRQSRETSTLFAEALLGRTTPLDPQAVFAGFMRAERPGEKAALREIERDNLPQYLMTSEVLLPFLRGLVPEDLSGVSGAEAAFSAFRAFEAEPGAVAGGDVEALRRELAELRSTLATQQQTIERLNARLDRNP